MNASPLRIFTNARLATLDPMRPGLGIVDNGAVAVHGGRIVHAGAAADLPTGFLHAAEEAVDCEGRWITPGLIDCHTHLVHAGNRAREFQMRLAGASYEEVARAGGGIVSSVRALRAASEDDLVAESLPRLDALIAEGVTTIEIKSGYGLDTANEAKALRAARRLAAERPVRVRTSFLGAHAVPPEFAGDRPAYAAHVAREMLPAIVAEDLADAVDGFCEGIAFTPDEIEEVFQAVRGAGLPVKLHADQLSDLGGAALAARYGALSADHLEYTGEEGAVAMARAGTVAVMLPAAFYFIRETKVPPIELFRRHGVPMAVATDCNPGTAPLTSLLLAMNMAATLFRMTVDECFAGVTRNAARALGLSDVGTLTPGAAADLCLWNVEDLSELVYRMGFNPLARRVFAGRDTHLGGSILPLRETSP